MIQLAHTKSMSKVIDVDNNREDAEPPVLGSSVVSYSILGHHILFRGVQTNKSHARKSRVSSINVSIDLVGMNYNESLIRV